MFVFLGFRRLLSTAGILLSLSVAASALMVWESSGAAFSATAADLAATSWAEGTLGLSDDDAGTALFAAHNLAPGSTGSTCITVSSTGSSAAAVRLYGTSYATTRGLADHVSLTVEEGVDATGTPCSSRTGGASIYSGTLAGFGTGRTGFSSGVGTWTPTGTASKTTYRISYSLAADTPNTAEGGTASLGFTWESQAS